MIYIVFKSSAFTDAYSASREEKNSLKLSIPLSNTSLKPHMHAIHHSSVRTYVSNSTPLLSTMIKENVSVKKMND